MNTDDHGLAERLAAAAGRHLVELRESAAGSDPAELRERGDRTTHELLIAELGRNRPQDAVLSEHGEGGPDRTADGRVWILDPLDGTREFGESGREDWAVHVALAEGDTLVAGAVALPAQDVVLTTSGPPARVDSVPRRPRIAVSRSRPPAFVAELAGELDAETVPMGSAGAKIAAVILGTVDAYVHAGGQYEWDSAAPVAVAQAAGLHTSRVNGDRLRYNQPSPWLPDLVVCRADLADPILDSLSRLDSVREA